MSLRIYGASDDLMEIEGHVRDELGAIRKTMSVEIGTKTTGGLRVSARYAPTKGGPGVWRMGVEPLDEDIPIPWPVRVELAERAYSCVVIVECPDDVPVFRGKRRLGS